MPVHAHFDREAHILQGTKRKLLDTEQSPPLLTALKAAVGLSAEGGFFGGLDALAAAVLHFSKLQRTKSMLV